MIRCPLSESQETLDPTQEATYQMLQRLFQEMTDLFESNWIHLGKYLDF